MVTVYYRKRKQTKISKGKRHTGQSPGENRYEFPVALSQWSCEDSTSLSQE